MYQLVLYISNGRGWSGQPKYSSKIDTNFTFISVPTGRKKLGADGRKLYSINETNIVFNNNNKKLLRRSVFLGF